MSRLKNLNALPEKIAAWVAKNPQHANTTRLYFVIPAFDEAEEGSTTLPVVGSNIDNAGAYNRIGPNPPKALVDPVDGWPRFRYSARNHGDFQLTDNRMEHLFTLDVRGVELGWIPKGAVAFSFFVSHSSMNAAHKNDNDETAVRFWSAEDMAKGWFDGEIPQRKYNSHENETFKVCFVDVPFAILQSSYQDRQADEEMKTIYSTVFSAAGRLGGPEMWVQGDPDEDAFGYGDEYDDEYGDEEGEYDEEEGGYDDEDDQPRAQKSKPAPEALIDVPFVGLRAGYSFMMQFDEGFVSVNLGDSGVMYVYPSGSFWQCY